MFGLDLDAWNAVMVSFLGVGAIAAVIVGVSSAIIIKLQKRADLESRQIIAKLNNDTARLQADNLALERIMTPRRWLGLSRGSTTQDGLWKLAEIWSEVAKFPKTAALIQVVPDFESQRLAADVMSGLLSMGWNPQFIGPDKSLIQPLSMPEGVQVWVSSKSGSTAAAKALAESMYFEGIRSDRPERNLYRDDPSELLLPDGDIRKAQPPDTVVILIGMRPALMELWQRQSDRERAAAGSVTK